MTAQDSRPGEGEAPGRACPSVGRHGTLTARSVDGCRCPSVAQLHTRYEKRRMYDLNRGRPRLTHPAGTTRRLQALAAIGWPGSKLAAELGCTVHWVRRLTNTRNQVRTVTATAVADLYDRLSDHPGPSAQTAGTARSNGYVPPIAWDDGTLDDPDAQPWMELHADGIRRPGRLQCARDDCRTWFVAHRGRMYCTPDCSYLAERERDRALRKAYYRDRDRAKRAAASTRRVAA